MSRHRSHAQTGGRGGTILGDVIRAPPTQFNAGRCRLPTPAPASFSLSEFSSHVALSSVIVVCVGHSFICVPCLGREGCGSVNIGRPATKTNYGEKINHLRSSHYIHFVSVVVFVGIVCCVYRRWVLTPIWAPHLMPLLIVH